MIKERYFIVILTLTLTLALARWRAGAGALLSGGYCWIPVTRGYFWACVTRIPRVIQRNKQHPRVTLSTSRQERHKNRNHTHTPPPPLARHHNQKATCPHGTKNTGARAICACTGTALSECHKHLHPRLLLPSVVSFPSLFPPLPTPPSPPPPVLPIEGIFLRTKTITNTKKETNMALPSKCHSPLRFLLRSHYPAITLRLFCDYSALPLYLRNSRPS